MVESFGARVMQFLKRFGCSATAVDRQPGSFQRSILSFSFGCRLRLRDPTVSFLMIFQGKSPVSKSRSKIAYLSFLPFSFPLFISPFWHTLISS